ncbi:MAG TPA: class 1 fructose-bisphosphatase, partial [Tenuifilaceae bacterium]|nr:class 1 fructose-bisphosphatase [Tenuifilaceae bacterium]
MKGYKIKTLTQFIIERQADFPFATGEFSRLLYQVGVAAKVINKKVNKAGLVDILGEAGEVNVQGEDQKKLDVFANYQLIQALKSSGECCGVASEEDQEIITFDSDLSRDGNYIFCMDPLDGSSNIDVNVSIGTIFSIYRRISPRGEKAVLEDFLQEGTKQIAAGYIIYG